MSNSSSREKVTRGLTARRLERARLIGPERRGAYLASSTPHDSRQTTAGALALLDPPAVELAPTYNPEAARKTILIVEDNPPMAELIREGIELEGEPDWVVQSAGGGLHALELVGIAPPAVMLLDVSLPDLDGAEVYSRLQDDPATRHTRVLFLSGCTPAELWQHGIEDGVLLRKPFDLGDLVAIVRAILQG